MGRTVDNMPCQSDKFINRAYPNILSHFMVRFDGLGRIHNVVEQMSFPVKRTPTFFLTMVKLDTLKLRMRCGYGLETLDTWAAPTTPGKQVSLIR